MNHQKSIIDAIIKVITEQECAVVPGFGGFILRRNPGMFNVFSGELKASTAILYFNAEIKEDDGLVANSLRELTGLSYKNCQSLLTQWKEELLQSVENNHHYNILPLGNFHKNAQGGLFFVSSPSLNLDPYSYGLPQFQWKWDLFDQPAETNNTSTLNINTNQNAVSSESHSVLDTAFKINSSSVETNNDNIKETEEERFTELEVEIPVSSSKSDKPGIIWQIAASLAIISVSTSLYFTFSQLLPGKKNAEVALATMNTPQKVEVENKLVRVKEIEKVQPKHQLIFGMGEEGLSQWHKELSQSEGDFYVTGASYITDIPAKSECLAWQKLGYDACVEEVKGSSLKKVILGRFKSETEASLFAKSIKEMPTGTISVIESKFKW